MTPTTWNPRTDAYANNEESILDWEGNLKPRKAREVKKQDPDELRRAERWITRHGYALTLILIFVWPVLSVPAGVFTKSYFAFWVLIAIAWGFGAAIVITVLPLSESAEDINTVLSGLYNSITGREAVQAEDLSLLDPRVLVKGLISHGTESRGIDSKNFWSRNQPTTYFEATYC